MNPNVCNHLIVRWHYVLLSKACRIRVQTRERIEEPTEVSTMALLQKIVGNSESAISYKCQKKGSASTEFFIRYTNCETYNLTFEIDDLIALSRSIKNWVKTEIATYAGTVVLQHTVLSALMSSFTWPAYLLKQPILSITHGALLVIRLIRQGKYY